jgi:hypothetical protein
MEDPDAVGEDYNVDEEDDQPRPFTALLDTGLKRTSTGSKVFAALKVRLFPLVPALDRCFVLLDHCLKLVATASGICDSC